MFSKVLLAAALSASAVSAYSMPACWSSCFAQYDISSEGCLCSSSMEAVVSSCIDTGCAASNNTGAATQYAAWLSSYCGSTGPVTVTDVTTEYTTICPVTATETSGSWTSTSVFTTTSTIQTSYQTSVYVTPSTWSSTVTSTVQTTASSTTWSPVTETSTVGTETSLYTWTTTSVVVVPTTYVTTMTPGLNTWTGTNSVPPVSPTAPYPIGATSTWSTASASGTGSWPSSTPPPYVGSASAVKAGGVLGAVAAAAVLLL